MRRLLLIRACWTLALGVGPWGAVEVVSAAEPPSYLLLARSEPQMTPEGARGCLLVRELARQAVLLAARDLGWATRDETLRESATAPDGTAALGLNVETTAMPGQTLAIRLLDPRSSGAVVWEGTVPLGEVPFDYLALARAVEELSATELAGALVKLAQLSPAQAPEWSDATVPEPVEGLLAQMNWFAQWQALRELHAAVAEGGPSPELLAGLVRGYAHLGLLSEYHLTAAHKAFKARALLYAARIQRVKPESLVGRWSQGYAAAWIGLHGAALAELAAAEKALEGLEGSAPPDWLPWVRAACQYDDPAFRRLPGEPRLRELAAVLGYTIYEHTTVESLWLPAGRKALEVSPECYRVASSMSRYRGVASRHLATAWAIPTLRARLVERVRQVPDAPPALVEAAAALAEVPLDENDPVLAGGAELRAFVAEATAAGKLGVDRREPSWECLARLVEDEVVVQGAYRLEFLMRGLGLPLPQMLQAMTATQKFLTGHPTERLLRALASDFRPNPARRAQLLAGYQLPDAELSAHPLAIMTWQQADDKPSFGQELWAQIWRHSDHTARELEQMAFFAQDPGFAHWLGQVSPESPQTSALLVLIDPQTTKLFRRAWEEKQGNRAVLLRALATQFAVEQSWRDAQRVLEKYLAQFPDQWGFSQLATAHEQLGDTAGWRTALEQSLNHEDFSLAHVSAQIRLARFDMSQGEFERALPYAESAAQTWSGHAMLCAAECYEGLGRWDEAEEWVRNTAERYSGSQLEWYLWCRRTGQGDVEAAFRLARSRARLTAAINNATAQERLAAFLFLAEEFEPAQAAYQRAFELAKHPFTALRWALVADRNEDIATRDRALGEAAENDQKDQPKNPGSAFLARWLIADLARPAAEQPDWDGLQAALEREPGTDRLALEAIAGRYLAAHGHVEQARSLLDQVAARRQPTWIDSILAGAARLTLPEAAAGQPGAEAAEGGPRDGGEPPPAEALD